MTQIKSAKNPLLQSLRRAAHSGRPTESGCIVIEGPKLLEEAGRGGWQVVQIFATAEAVSRHGHHSFRSQSEVVEVADRALDSVSATETSQGVIALVRPAAWRLDQVLAGRALVVIMDGIQDPGNAGSLVRSSEAFGATGVVSCNGSVRSANGKFLRATAGSIFRLPFVEDVDTRDLLRALRSAAIDVYWLERRAEIAIGQADLKRPCALVVGNEGHGVSTAFHPAGSAIRIPTSRVESLNAAVAGSIALFECARQRNSG